MTRPCGSAQGVGEGTRVAVWVAAGVGVSVGGGVRVTVLVGPGVRVTAGSGVSVSVSELVAGAVASAAPAVAWAQAVSAQSRISNTHKRRIGAIITGATCHPRQAVLK